MQKALIYGGLIFAAYYIYKRVKAFDVLRIDLVGVSFQGNIVTPIILLKFRLQNNSNVSATVTNFSGGVYINDAQKVADVQFNEPTIIAPYTSTFVTLPVTSFLPTILNNLSVLFSKKLSSVSFNGYTTVDGFSLPINVNQSL